MADSSHVHWLKEGVKCWNKRRTKVEFCPDLSGLNFFEVLPDDFRDDPKTSRYFEKIDLSHADLTEADLSNLNFSDANFDNANLAFSNMSRTNFSKASFKKANLTKTDLRGSFFDDAFFEDTNLLGSEFAVESASGAVFINSKIHGVARETLGALSAGVFESRLAYDQSLDAEPSELVADRVPGPRLDHTGKTKKNKYDVFFGTNRSAVFERGTLVDFGPNRAESLSYGVCEVIVPEGHRVGSLGSRLWKRLVNRKDDRLKIDALIALDEKTFFDYLTQTAARMRVFEKPTIFVHGFNNTFSEAVLRAAQIGHDLGLGQGIGLFSWPSQGSKGGYSADEATVEVSENFLADFISLFWTKVPRSKSTS